MNLTTGRTQLYSALKTLRLRWGETKEVWTDAVRKDFEEDFFVPLDQQVLTTLRAIDRLSEIISEMRQQCGDREM